MMATQIYAGVTIRHVSTFLESSGSMNMGAFCTEMLVSKIIKALVIKKRNNFS